MIDNDILDYMDTQKHGKDCNHIVFCVNYPQQCDLCRGASTYFDTHPCFKKKNETEKASSSWRKSSLWRK